MSATARPSYVLVAHCRAGFEPETARDLARLAASASESIDVDAPAGRGFVVARLQRLERGSWQSALSRVQTIFARSMFLGTGPHSLFDRAPQQPRPDRIAPLAELIESMRAAIPPDALAARPGQPPAPVSLRLETPDTNEGKELSGLARALDARLTGELRRRGALAAADAPASDARHGANNLHVLFTDGATVFVGASCAPWASSWPMGIPRLKMPRGAPSRSTLKLAEAIVTFVGERETELLHPGMRAVDLGAAPGGWTWQLARRGLRVTAVDNGPLKGEVSDDPLVAHVRADGLTWRAPRAVDWMVCDIVEQPARIAVLVARWIGEGRARRSIFNLKLPMKKRFDEIERCAAIIADHLARDRVAYRLALRQLYHDRAEVTGYLERI